MAKRYMSLWFPQLTADWTARKQPELKNIPFVLALAERGRMIVKAANRPALSQGIGIGSVVADARAVCPHLQVLDAETGRELKLLTAIAAWAIRYSPVVAVDLPDGLMLEISGCPHLWGGEGPYREDMTTRLGSIGYHVRSAIAGTAGAAWAVARYGNGSAIIAEGKEAEALASLPPDALRLEPAMTARLHKLGLYRIGSFMDMPRTVLRRRFGQLLPHRLAQALGHAAERLIPVQPIEPYQERLPCLEPLRTATAIEIAVKKLLDSLCDRLLKERRGLRSAVLKCYRIDGCIQQVEIGTNAPVRNTQHLLKLFKLKTATIRPGLGIELFILEAPVVEELSLQHETLWSFSANQEPAAVSNLLDRLAVRIGADAIKRYQPDQHYWPERSYKLTAASENKEADWVQDTLRPVCLLPQPERIDVTAPIPDYPPMLFGYKGRVHKIRKADGPERIEQEWWLQQGQHRDYYTVEDEDGGRYWLFRAGHYDEGNPEWFLQGFFA